MTTTSGPPALRRRPVAGSIAELVAGATDRRPFRNADGKSGSGFERLTIDGWRRTSSSSCTWTTTGSPGRSATSRAGRSPCGRPACSTPCPRRSTPTVVGAARGLGRNGWGAALLMRDVGDHLVPEGDEVVAAAQHAAFVDHLAELSARFWGWRDTVGLTPLDIRWSFFGDGMLARERERGWRDPVPAIADRGWRAFAERAPADVRALVGEVRAGPWRLAEAVAATPSTFLHGDWKMGNLGSHPDGRTILIDCAYPGEGPVCHELGWYLAINSARLPEPKEDTIARLRAGLERHGVDTTGWWDRQLDLCLLGTVVQFGWEKALGPDEELHWWVERARAGGAWL